MNKRKQTALEVRDMILQTMGIDPKDVPYEEDPNDPNYGDPNWIDMSAYMKYEKKGKK